MKNYRVAVLESGKLRTVNIVDETICGAVLRVKRRERISEKEIKSVNVSDV